MKALLRGGVLVLFGLFSGVVSAVVNQPPEGYEFEEPTPWKETGKTLPPFPNDDDLLPVNIDTVRTTFNYFIDSKNLAVSEDGVVTYTVVITSDSGAKNVLHEGIRCGIRKYKTYAYGGSDGKLQEVKEAVWRKIDRSGPTAFRNDFYNYYLCDELDRSLSPREIIERIQHPQAVTKP